ncbi:MAG: hypothetical protein H6738_24495 [Alphaproteobacteria bacterium]|nr:hypothetical protein [Alphaproteobacteria bacterium]MCB9699970.1 hypothetical protein [Alphaproteobacteria bacterium]
MASWTDLKSSWSSAWTGLQQRASSAYQAAIQANPGQFRDKVASFLSLLSESRASLDRTRELLKQVNDPALASKAGDLESRYATLASGVYADAQPADTVGVAPVIVGGIVVAGIIVSVAGVAWAVAAYEYAVNLREHTSLLEKELQARVDASKEGRVLQPSSVPPVPNPVADAKSTGLWVLGGLAVTAAAIAVPIFLKKRAG